MKTRFAIVNGERHEAAPGLKGVCNCCGSEVIARCGQVNVWHWAHKAKQDCDPWWENEGEWHRGWKDRFPSDWHEIVHTSDMGERHIADVKTMNGWVVEFQHSKINLNERISRDNFYPKLLWIVDGTRRKRDWTQFLNALNDGVRGPYSKEFFKVSFPEEYPFLRDWLNCKWPVFFDFGEMSLDGEEALWCMIPQVTRTGPYILQFSKDQLLKHLLDQEGDQLPSILDHFINLIKQIENLPATRASLPFTYKHAFQVRPKKTMRYHYYPKKRRRF